MNESNKQIPFSYLVLYAKGWISFPWITGENKLWEDLKVVMRMEGYYKPCKRDIVNLCLIATDKIVKFHKDHNIDVPFGFRDFYEFVREAQNSAWHYKDKSIESIIVYHILSSLRIMKTHDFVFNKINYKKYKFKLDNSNTSTTYSECQKRFNKSFNDRAIENKYEYLWENLRKL